MANQPSASTVLVAGSAPVAAAQGGAAHVRARRTPSSSSASARPMRPRRRAAGSPPSRAGARLQRVGEGEQRLGHAVALEHGHAQSPSSCAPQVGRQRGRARDAEAQPGQLAGPARGGEAVVHGRHAEEHGAASAWAASSTASSSKRSNTVAERAGGQRAEQPGAQPVDVEEGEGEDEAVVRLPAPGARDGRHAGKEGGVGVHRPLGPARRPRGVDDRARRRRAQDGIVVVGHAAARSASARRSPRPRTSTEGGKYAGGRARQSARGTACSRRRRRPARPAWPTG